MKPSNYQSRPYNSALQNWQSETIARNVMLILMRTGNEWRPLMWDEYKAERMKDSGFTPNERAYFDKVVPYCESPEKANAFCKGWASANM